MPERAGDPDALGRVRSNRHILARMREGAAPSSDGVGPWSPDGWVMRTHPDLTEQLESATTGIDAQVELVYGLASAVTSGSIIVGVGMGTSAVWLRVEDGPAFDKAQDEGAEPVDGLRGWLRVDAWRIDLHDWLDASTILAGPRWRPGA
jgi:hypothetical protein